MPESLAVSTREKKNAEASAPSTVWANSQFFLLCSIEHRRNYVLSKDMLFRAA
jgi:hypothetical protein